MSTTASYEDAEFYPEMEDEAYDHYEEMTEPARYGWIVPALAITAVLGWTGLYGWAMRAELLAAPQTPPAQWVRWIIDWSVPVLLIGIAWLIAMRNSRSEARRFADTAAMLSHESARLESRLNVVNRELSVAREFLGAQSLELESLGRIASEKISAHAAELQDLITTNGEQVDRIGTTSEAALSNMTKLRDDLPVVANSARDVSNQVGNAGRTAHEQVEKLIGGFQRLNEFGSASEVQVNALGKRVGETLSVFETQLSMIEALVTNRFETLQAQTEAYRGEIESSEKTALGALSERITLLQAETKAVSTKLRDAEVAAMEQLHQSKERLHDEVGMTVESLDKLDQHALAAAKRRVEELRDEASRFDDMLAQRDQRFNEEMERRQADFDTREAQASEVLAQRLAELDEAIATRREAQSVETAKLVAHSQEMSEQLDRLGSLISDIGKQGDETRSTLSLGMRELDEQLAKKREALSETEAQLTVLTDAGIRLLEIIQSGAKHSREDLPQAIGVAAGDLGNVEQRAEALSSAIMRTSQQSNDIGDYLVKTQEALSETDSSIDALQSKLNEQSEDTLAKLQGLRAGFAKLSSEGDTFGEKTQETLREALNSLETATRSAFTALDEGAREKVASLADTISEDAVEALERSLRNNSAETIGKLEQAAAHASGVGREATVQLRDQLAKVNELTGNLEQRVTRARELAEEQVNNDFARRMALITDSLNSNAIDITGALSQDVTDTAWDAYLKGDRGIFTRRAVRLIDNGEAREIAELYQNDDAFKGNVSRYIHDFEQMLRSMLSTRDGNALGVTLLGSDMGKLYVVLAQAIERFR
ncbi:ATPase [Erythrobacter rubeus]|uniref:ATPase n=1 Tax=Erythrobacter rubeus TaxID=2760803 RepID=A0ABR8KTF1_9SPHN|nr:ATPase [Erythrobacter rubeus]MBD2841714.1 ATPase [Erythrobacter rubeus]